MNDKETRAPTDEINRGKGPVQSCEERSIPVTSKPPIVHLDFRSSNSVTCRPVHEPLLLIHRPPLFPTSSSSCCVERFHLAQRTAEVKLFSPFSGTSIHRTLTLDGRILYFIVHAEHSLPREKADEARLPPPASPKHLAPVLHESPVKTTLSNLAAVSTEERLPAECLPPQKPIEDRQRRSRQQSIINDHGIPLALRTSLHSVTSLHHDDYILSHYFHSLAKRRIHHR